MASRSIKTHCPPLRSYPVMGLVVLLRIQASQFSLHPRFNYTATLTTYDLPGQLLVGPARGMV